MECLEFEVPRVPKVLGVLGVLGVNSKYQTANSKKIPNTKNNNPKTTSFIQFTPSFRERHDREIPYFNRLNFLLLLRQDATQEFPQSFLLRDDDGACERGNEQPRLFLSEHSGRQHQATSN